MSKTNLKPDVPKRCVGLKRSGFCMTAAVQFLILAAVICVTSIAQGQEVSVQVSTREAWVGSPVVLQLQIRNAKNYSLPDDFDIDGCDVRSAGTPSQSSQIMIINGRRSESRSVTMQYLITPRREGQFQIPALEIKVDGQTKKTQAINFVAAKSETGDLLLVEVEGDKQSVYVGQPLDIKLKIWIKPYSDSKSNIKLDESQMWQLLSEQTSWGAFSDRMRELAENRQRPGGESVLRKDNEDRSREYFLYEISGTIYPTKAGKIDASDLRVVINYPLSLGRRRDPFDSFFGDSFFSSPFSRRLTVSESRPIVAEAKVNSTEVLPVPTEGQPADYRGAVGRYEIVAEAEPKNVTAGDPITLRLGIVGDGPMELVQAPPLHEIDSLASDFQVTDQSLAGFVQDDTKVFVTTIRPVSEEVVQIPPIPFSFFDPDKKAYQTVYSDPISVEVEKAESLQFNAIVSNAKPVNSGGNADAATSDVGSDLNLGGQDDLLAEVATQLKKWWYVVLIPPACLLLFYLCKFAFAFPAIVRRMRSPVLKARQAIAAAEHESVLIIALQSFVASETKADCPTFGHAVGQLRACRDYDTAREMESFYDRICRTSVASDNWLTAEPEQSLSELKAQSSVLLEKIQRAWRNRRKTRILAKN